ncbi:MAG: hypothetical protein K6T31_01785, partial [Alicyclobacillus sp.]|nr:hypothetical protein [Alicyclobacillus sp.]
AIATAIASALTNRPVHREVAMTGEITLRGRVLAIGGLKEKALAAHRAGLQTVLIPADNEKDVRDIPESVRSALKFVRVKHMDEVLATALCPAPLPGENPLDALWTELPHLVPPAYSEEGAHQ